MPELVLPMGANFVWRIFRIINISRLYLKCFNCFAALFYVSRIRYDHAAKNIFKSWRMQLRVSLLRFKSAYICCKWLKVPKYLCVWKPTKKMVKKCCIPDCRSNYAPSRKNKIIEKSYVKVFRFPRDANKLEPWKKMMPYRNLNISKDSVICVKHWPDKYATMRGKWNKDRPTEPPRPLSVWPGVPPSCVGTNSKKSTKTN